MRFTTLINSQQLATLQANDDVRLRIIDCRFDLMQPHTGEEAYHSQHIAGAIYAHLDRDLSGAKVDGVTGRHPLPTLENLVATLSAWGIDDQTQVVLYDDKGGMFAARLWWMLRWVGHEAVAVLDGGLDAWIAADLPVNSDTPVVSNCEFQVRVQNHMLVDAADVLAAMSSEGVCILDARGFDRYCGENETIDSVAGHIPTALSAPFANNLEKGQFKSHDQLYEQYHALLGDREAIVYCGSGVTAAHDLLAMAYAGITNGRLYAGSWSHWIVDPSRPVAIGSKA